MRKVVVILHSATQRADRAALSLAMRLIETQTHALCFDEPSLQYALAAGIEAHWFDGAPKHLTADFDIALVGGSDDLSAATLAQGRQASLVLNVLDIEHAQNAWRITRDLGRGARDILRVCGPVVVGISDDAANRLYVSRYRRQSAGAIPPLPSPSNADRPADWQPMRPRTKAAILSQKTAGSATERALAAFGVTSNDSRGASEHVLRADAATCAEHLLRYLAHHGFISARHGASAKPSAQSPSATLRAKSPMISPMPSRNTVSQRIARGPRPEGGVAAGMHRRPRPLSPSPPPASAGKLLRRPRPLGASQPTSVRGPYPVGS